MGTDSMWVASALPERAAAAEEGCALRGRNAVVLARPHRELAEPVLRGQLAQAGEVGSRRLRVGCGGRHGHQAEHRDAEARDELEEAGQLVRLDPGLRRPA